MTTKEETTKKESFETRFERTIFQSINRIFKERIHCETLKELSETCLSVAEELTGSKFGWIGELNPVGKLDTIAISNPGWDACNMPESDATIMISNMELRGLWASVIHNGQSMYTNDPMDHPDSVGIPEGHPPLTSFLGVPLKKGDQVVGMISLGNKEGGYDDSDIYSMERLAVAVNEAIHSKRSELKIARQTQELLEISTPVLQIWDGMVVAPLIGTLDSQRTQHFMERLLQSIVDYQAPIALVDITGVPTVDTQTAHHLIETVSAAKLLGAKVILTGISPEIAQTLIHLGIDLSSIDTRSSLASGLIMALEKMNMMIVDKKKQL